MSSAKKQMLKLLNEADIEVGGARQQDIHVHNEDFYKRIMGGGRLALGESYMDGWWSANQLDAAVCQGLCKHVERKLSRSYYTLSLGLLSRLTNRQSKRRAFQVGKEHYDIGNELYTQILDPWMQYSCGYWKEGVSNLKDAQIAKMDLICRKLELQPGMRVLDIGSGWGGLAKFMAYHYKVSVVGLTISKEQVEFAEVQTENLPVEFKLTDYRDLRKESKEQFDRIVSVGMFEHVGYKNYRTYMKTVFDLLKDDGFFLLHTIGDRVSSTNTDPWIDKYIFPNGMLPSLTQVAKATEDLFVLEDWHNFGADYDHTLMAWHENFKAAWPELKTNGKYDDRFRRMWEYYLLASAGNFRSRQRAQLWQIVLGKNGKIGGYRSKR